MLSRRHLFGASAVAIAAVALPVAAGAVSFPVSADAAIAYAEQESRAINAIVDRLNAGRFPQEEWDVWEERDTRFLTWAEGLPLTPEYARAKAIAFRTIYDRNGGVNTFLDDMPTTDNRLALQVIKCVLGGLN